MIINIHFKKCFHLIYKKNYKITKKYLMFINE